MFREIVVIPVYNHDRYLPTLVNKLVKMQLPVLLVDDGSTASCAAVIDAIVQQHPTNAQLLRLPKNQGKGYAFLAGLHRVADNGFTHVVQIDADGQHTVEDTPQLLDIARAHPEALVTGQPVFDESVPLHRLYLRYLTHYMVAINTLNFQLVDAMCGFRVYPVKEVLELERKIEIGHRMEFDIDILVRLDWAGVPVLTKRTAVRYPIDGVSHFRLWRDNVRITSLHIRLFFGMLWRIPRLLFRTRQVA
ncbi:MAG: glycosyltransferase family 2 protein [Gemmatimonas sp.]